MAKKVKGQEQSPKKLIQDKIITHLLQEFQQLEALTGKKEFAKRLKKSAKIITQGLKFEEATKEDLAAGVQPAVAAPRKATAKKVKPAAQKVNAAPKKTAQPARGVKSVSKKTAGSKSGAKPAVKKAKSGTSA